MSKTFLTSDTHFFHNNIIGFCNRPYSSVEEMNHKLIQNWNMVVQPEDHVWHLGDISFGKGEETEQILSQLNGIKHLIMGNHDRDSRCEKPKWEKHFVSIDDYKRVTVDVGSIRYKMVLCHFPFASWERGYYQFHGHMHSTPGNCTSKWTQHDVGVDMNNFTPLLLQDAVNRSMCDKEQVKLY